jgi:hypothetical protein
VAEVCRTGRTPPLVAVVRPPCGAEGPGAPPATLPPARAPGPAARLYDGRLEPANAKNQIANAAQAMATLTIITTSSTVRL